MKGKSRKTALTQTTKEYASRSSIHGISYLFDLELGIADRLLWFFLVLVFAAVAAALTWNLWVQWRNEQVNAFMYKKINSRLNHSSIFSKHYSLWTKQLSTRLRFQELELQLFWRTVTFRSQITPERSQCTSNYPRYVPKLCVGPFLKPKGFYRASPKISFHWPPPSKCESNLRDFAKSDSVCSKSDSNFRQIL